MSKKWLVTTRGYETYKVEKVYLVEAEEEEDAKRQALDGKGNLVHEDTDADPYCNQDIYEEEIEAAQETSEEDARRLVEEPDDWELFLGRDNSWSLEPSED